VPPNRLEGSAALLVRVWTEHADPGTVRFRILTSTPGQPTQVVARGRGRDELLEAVRAWLEEVAGPDGAVHGQ
jgi:hypothetical protein